MIPGLHPVDFLWTTTEEQEILYAHCVKKIN